MGSGSFGDVHYMFDQKSRERFALKTIKNQGFSAQKFRDYCFNEIKILLDVLKIKNSKLLQIYKIDYIPNEKCEILMECGHGNLEDLMNFLKNNSYSCPGLLTRAHSQLQEQIEILAQNGIVHLDIKPANIIITTKGFDFKLTDFGCSMKVKNPYEVQEIPVCGSPAYMSNQIFEAYKNSCLTCKVSPYETDMESLEKSLSELSQVLAHGTKEISIEDLEQEFRAEMICKIFVRAGTETQKMVVQNMLENYLLGDLQIKINKALQNHRQDGSSCLEQEIFLLGTLGMIKEKLEQFEEAEALLKETIPLALQLWRETDPRMAPLYESMGVILMEKNQFSQAMINLDRAMTIYQAEDDWQNIARVYGSKGSLYLAQGEYESCFENLNVALKIITERLPNEICLLAEVYTKFGALYIELNDFSNGMLYHKMALDIRKQLNQENHPKAAENYRLIGIAYLKQKNFEEAKEYFQKSLEIREKFFPESPIITKTQRLLLDTYRQEDLVFSTNSTVEETTRLINASLSIFNSHNIYFTKISKSN